MSKILIINGPNLNLLGEREPGIYGDMTLESINKQIGEYALENGFEQCDFFQSNHEGAIIDKIHEARLCYDGIVLNAGAYTHYSYAIRDAIAAIKIPVVEVHLSNINNRDSFREKSVIAPVCAGSISGFGRYSYILGVQGVFNILMEKNNG